MIMGFARQVYAQEALALFAWMQNLEANEAIPDEISLHGVLCACSGAGFVDDRR